MFAHPDNAAVITRLGLDATDRFEPGGECSGFDEGGQAFFHRYGAAIPNAGKWTSGITNLLVHPLSGLIVAFHWGRFTFVVRGEGKQRGETLDGSVDFSSLDGFALVDDPQEDIEAAYLRHGRVLTVIETYTQMPWKNGGGVTEQIVIEPHDATIDNFTWRVSTARVASGGPFSRFTGYERVLVVIEGDGLVLNGTLLPPFTPHTFSGDDDVNATLMNGPIRDFNVIARRGTRVVCTVVNTPAIVEGGATQLVVNAGSTLRVDDGFPLTVAGEGVVIHVSIG